MLIQPHRIEYILQLQTAGDKRLFQIIVQTYKYKIDHRDVKNTVSVTRKCRLCLPGYGESPRGYKIVLLASCSGSSGVRVARSVTPRRKRTGPRMENAERIGTQTGDATEFK